MLGFLNPRGELVELSGRRVVFLADKAYARDAQFQVRLSLPEPSDQKFDVDVRVLSQRPGPRNKLVTIAVVETPREFPDLMGHPLRMSRREPCRLTLKSGDLPGYRAVTHDLSIGGFKTELEGELACGDVIVVAFEFDNPVGLSLDLRAKVQWVDAKGGGRFATGFSFSEQGPLQANYDWLCEWFENRGDGEVKQLFRSVKVHKEPPPKPKEEPTPEPEPLDKDLSIRIPFKGFLRGWAWEEGDDMVVIVLEDDDGTDHWLEFPGCRGLHARCRDRKIRFQGVRLVADSPLIQEYSRSVTFENLYHFEFLDDYARVCLDIVAAGCREQKRLS
jgi:PilZ domain